MGAASPRLVSTFADAASDPSVAGSWTEKVIVQRVRTQFFRGDLAVVSFQACESGSSAFRGFGLYDVTDPAAPRKMALVRTPRTRGSHEIWLGAARGKAYVYTAIINSELTTSPDYDPEAGTATTPGRADFRIVEVSNPSRPVQVAEWGAWRKLGIAPNADGRSNFVHSVRVDDQLRRAYLSYWDLGTVILDIRDPLRPRYLGRTSPSQGAAHSTYITDGGRTLIETHETQAGLPQLYDITNPARPRLLSTFAVEGFQNDTVHDPKIRGQLAFFSWYSLGVVAANISKPRAPRQVAQFVPDTDYLPRLPLLRDLLRLRLGRRDLRAVHPRLGHEQRALRPSAHLRRNRRRAPRDGGGGRVRAAYAMLGPCRSPRTGPASMRSRRSSMDTSSSPA